MMLHKKSESFVIWHGSSYFGILKRFSSEMMINESHTDGAKRLMIRAPKQHCWEGD